MNFNSEYNEKMAFLDDDDKKFILKWFLGFKLGEISFVFLVAVITWALITHIPNFVNASMQIPVELSKLNGNFEKLDNTLEAIDYKEAESNKKNIEILETVRENNSILRGLR